MTIHTTAALLFEQPGEWRLADVELDEPHRGEVLVELAATGLCHSDDHCATGDMPSPLPLCGGHEGAGVVTEVGPGVTTLAEGDHVVTTFIPACGHCSFCAGGMFNLCENGAALPLGCMLDGTYRMHIDGKDVAQYCCLGTFAERIVTPVASCVKIPAHVPLATACLLGCGVPTGWGSAVNVAGVRPGDLVAVMGVGGVGINAVQGARHAGATRIVAVDPVPFKRDMARSLGATDSVESMAEATELVLSLTKGQGADAVIVTVGVLHSAHLKEAFRAVRKGGTLVVTSVAPITEEGIPINLVGLALWQRSIKGSLYGGMSPQRDIPRLLTMYESGQLKLDELVTRTYSLEDINQGYADMHDGTIIRGVIRYPGRG